MPPQLSSPKTLFVFLLGAAPLLIYPTGRAAAEAPPFNVARLVVGTDVQAREPIGVADVFPAGTQTVCCFLEAREITQVTEVEMVWFFGDEEVARVPLTLGAGARWRTYSRKQIGAHRGNWKVDLQDMAGQILGTVQFMVE